MSLTDKILSLFEKYGSLSSERVESLLKRDYKIWKTRRTIQRYINQLLKDKKLTKNPPVRREQTYAVSKEKPSSISDFFLSKFWDELFRIRDELLAQKSEDPYAESWNSFHKLRLLVSLLPKEMKEKIKPKIESFGVITDKDKEEVKKRIPGSQNFVALGGIPLREIDRIMLEEGKNIVGQIQKRRVEDIIGEVATLLHEALEKERGEP